MSKRLLLVPCLLILAALSLSACGGGGDSSGSSGSDDATAAIEHAITESATSTDKAKCTEFDTQAFSEQNTHEKGAAAVKACEAEADGDNNADSIEVSSVEVDGEKATAEATPSGSTLDGQTLSISLVEEDGQWKLDQIDSFSAYDNAALEDVFRTKLGETGELSDSQVACIAKGVGKASQKEAEELLLSGSSTPFIKLAAACAQA